MSSSRRCRSRFSGRAATASAICWKCRTRRSRPAIVRRLEEFIEAHWREPLSIDRLVAETSVSARSIFRAFLRARGYSPMAFAKAVRLRHARAMLTSGDPGVSLAPPPRLSSARSCQPGFTSRVTIAKAFGELPSETILRSRR